MNSNTFKEMFGTIAKDNGFERAYEGWFKEYPEIIQVLDLQKSNYGNFYYLNVKLFIQGVFGNKYVKSKYLVKNDSGDIFLRQPDQYSKMLDLDFSLENNDRMEGLKKMFHEFIMPFMEKTNTKKGIIELHQKENLFILPAVKEELGI